MVFANVFVNVYYMLVEHFLIRCAKLSAVYAGVSPLGLRAHVVLSLEVSLHVALLVGLEVAQLTVVLFKDNNIKIRLHFKSKKISEIVWGLEPGRGIFFMTKKLTLRTYPKCLFMHDDK